MMNWCEKFFCSFVVFLLLFNKSKCQSCLQGAVRLVDGNNVYEGRVEICYNNQWGTVCDDAFGRADSAVVCRQLGFSYAGASSPNQAHFGQGTGPIWLDNVACTGTEDLLINCPRGNPIGTHNCDHSEDASTRCIPIFNCTDGDIRLVDGMNELEGRVEVCVNGTWGTVCDDFWGVEEASVSCSQLGFSPIGAVAQLQATFGQGIGSIFIDNVVCDGQERRLIDCASNPLAAHDCSHAEDAGVTCQPAISPCTQGDIRLVAGALENEGRVEVCNQNQWGSVCDMDWSIEDARVACYHAGYAGTASLTELLTAGAFGSGTGPIWMSGLNCSGTEVSLFECTSSVQLGWVQNRTSCTHSNDVAVRCQGLPSSCTTAEQGYIRLANSSTPYEGRVEICYNNQWGTVCDDSWGALDAGMACRQLGFSPWAATPITRGGYGQGTGPVLLDNVACSGRESRLIDCPANPIGSHNCDHSEDAGVICAPLFVPGPDIICSSGDVRLVEGTNPLEGRVEVCFYNQWGTVCDSFWGDEESRVVCRQLGYSGTIATPLYQTPFGQGSGPIVANSIMCSGNEPGILNCTYDLNHNCGHANDVSVRCVTAATGCTTGAIRLAGAGSSSSQGRVEVCNNNQWGTVCDDTWNSLDASVACFHLGYSNIGATGQRNAAYGLGSGPILLDQVQCIGNESNIFDCPRNQIGVHDCSHSEDAGVTCTSRCHDGDLRLVGGMNITEGRLEFCYGGVWGTVCRDSWGAADARVACRQLGFSTAGADVILNATAAGFGVATGPVLIDETRCVGDETRLINCRHNGVGTLNCDHRRDVGLRCRIPECTNGDVRLVGGSYNSEGRVEFCHDEGWGTVCSGLTWDTIDAQVVCRQLGFPVAGATALRAAAQFGPGTGRVWLSNVACTLDDPSLANCTFGTDIGTNNCGHNQDAGVICFTQFDQCNEGDIRLVGGITMYEGRVEVCHNNIWGTVCDDFLGRPDSAVICRQLGFGYAGSSTPTQAHFGEGTGPIWLDNAACTGTEASLFDCSANPIGTHNCDHSEDVGTRCIPIFNCTNGDIRLLDGSTALEGRVEVCVNGVWGTVCSDLWGNEEASVTCSQLGFSQTEAQPRTNAAFGQGVGDIFLDNVVCDGNELRLVDCASNPFATHNCQHTQDAGVVCQAALSPCNQGDIRLVSGSAANEGRVEICNNNTWGSVCDQGWDINDASVACRHAGYSGNTSMTTSFTSAAFGQGIGRIWMSGLTCTGTESSLFSCSSSISLGSVEVSTTCTHSNDVAVRCQGLPTDCSTAEQGNVRLANGSTPYEGRVEICYNNQWGTVCDDSWGALDAGMACRQLGFSPWAATPITRGGYGQGTGPVLLDNVACSGRESRLIDCPANPIGSHNCDHSEDAGVICAPLFIPGPDVICNNGAVRLVGGSNPLEGRVEVCSYNQWGTICDISWRTQEAQVICRQLGYSGASATPFLSAAFGQGDGPIVLGNVICSGAEDQLVNCTNELIHNCISHSNDVGVRCIPSTLGCTTGAVRLAGTGSSSTQGRVEVCNNNQWGTVCDDTWNNVDASVACFQLGYNKDGATGQRSATYGQGTGPIQLRQVQCVGDENGIISCPSTTIGTQNCQHNQDAGVTCIARCHDGDLRLVGGMNITEGRLEFCYGGVWGTVCRDSWGAADARVACRQLGFSTTGTSIILNATAAGFGVATGPVLIDETNCIGTENRLANCRHGGVGTLNCDHSRDVGLRCRIPVCSNGDVRLSDGSNNSGRVEFCFDRVWGTVCDGQWDTVDAQVVCRQLGFPIEGATALRGAAQFGPGEGRVWLSQVNCTLNNTSLSNCNYGVAIGANTCGHNRDAGVICFTNFTSCVEGTIRLVGGITMYEGRVEVCHNNIWGTVCDDFLGRPDSAVVCRQLGFGYSGASTPTQAHFGQGIGPIWLDNTACLGTEARLIDCPANPLGSHNCDHSEDVGTRCIPVFNCTDGDIRVVNGATQLEGRVEVCIDGVWGTVCDDLWGVEEASVACRQLGFSPTGAIPRTQAVYGQGTGPIFIDNVVCDGQELRLLDCASSALAAHDCTHSKDAGVVCTPMLSPCTQGDIRLVAGSASNEGRVEICNNNEWGSVCDSGWDINDARVACRQAGYSGESTMTTALPSAAFGEGTGQIWISDLSCTGDEITLFSCSTNTPLGTVESSTSCMHSNDVAVRCQGLPSDCLPSEQGYIRLANGSTPYEGRVEVCYNGQWGTVCDDSWGGNDAGVACRQLGFSPWASTAITRGGYGQGTGPILLDNLLCGGREANLFDCRGNAVGNHNCDHSEDAGVICAPLFIPGPDVICVTGDVRLVGGSNPLEGRLEVCFYNQWGTICSASWSANEALVACKQLGYAGASSTPTNASNFELYDGPIIGSDAVCNGSESRIVDCIFDRNNNCDHINDLAVRCLATASECQDGAIRLAGAGSSSTQGRVEVCNSNQWGTVCDDTWNSLDASVACFQLGYSNEGATGQRSAAYGQGSRQVLLGQVQCIGNETNVFSCPQNNVGMQSCSHSQDAGVTCAARCHDGDLRLVGGKNATEGRLEFCYGGVWGTVCRDQWGAADARVACRQLGFPAEGAVVILNASEAGYGVPNGPVLIDESNCLGTENRLSSCRHGGVGTLNCDHTKDIGLRCQAEAPQLVITPNDQYLYHREPLRLTCVASAGSEVSYGSDPTDIIWIDADGQLILPLSAQNESRITISKRVDTIESIVFIESTLEICSASYEHYGRMSCIARRAVGADTASWSVIPLDVSAPQLIISPNSFLVECKTEITMTCTTYADPLANITWIFNGTAIVDTVNDLFSIYQRNEELAGRVFSESFLKVCSFNSDNIGNYQCITTNPIDTATSTQGLVAINLDTVPAVQAPIITMVQRTSDNEVVVAFNPQFQDGVFDVSYYIANNDSLPDLSKKSGTVRTTLQQTQVTASDLEACNNYWMIVTAVYCGRRSDSEPKLTGFNDIISFELVVSLRSSDVSCSNWISINPQQKIMDMESGLRQAEASCGFQIPCFKDSTWMCMDDDSTKISFQTQLVGDDPVSSAVVKKCINDWIASGPDAVQSLPLGGSILEVSNVKASSTSAQPAVIGIVVVLVIIVAVGAVIAIFVVAVVIYKRKDKNLSAFPRVIMSKKDENLIKPDDDDIGQDEEVDLGDLDDRYSIAVVENPLYAEHEGSAAVSYHKGDPGEDAEEEIKIDYDDYGDDDLPI